MKTTQYVRQEKAIATADSNVIRERWLWGLRLLRNPAAMSSEKSLRHGITDQLVAAAQAAGLKLTAREIQRRLQCARTYPTEAQMRRVTSDFESWFDLLKADFVYLRATGQITEITTMRRLDTAMHRFRLSRATAAALARLDGEIEGRQS